MIMAEFYRLKLYETNKKIQQAEDNKDFKLIAKLEAKKASIKCRMKEIEKSQG